MLNKHGKHTETNPTYLNKIQANSSITRMIEELTTHRIQLIESSLNYTYSKFKFQSYKEERRRNKRNEQHT